MRRQDDGWMIGVGSFDVSTFILKMCGVLATESVATTIV